MLLNERKNYANNFWKNLRIVNPNGENVLINNYYPFHSFLFENFKSESKRQLYMFFLPSLPSK